MPYDIKTKDGIVLKNIPDNVAPDAPELQERVAAERAKRDSVTAQGAGEVALQMATGAAGEVASGLAGIGAGVATAAGNIVGLTDRDPMETAANVVGDVRDFITSDVETPGGIALQKKIGESVLGDAGELFSNVENKLGDTAFDITGSPAAAAIAKSIPTAIIEAIGAKAAFAAAKQAGKGALMFPDGRPTAKFRKALEKQGVEFDNITEAMVGEFIEHGTNASDAAQDLVKAQLAAGETGKGLAEVALSKGGEIIKYKPGVDAIKQGYRKGFVAEVAAASPVTRAKITDMVRKMRRIKDNEALLDKFTPTDPIGESLMVRLKRIKTETVSASKELNQIAASNLKGQPIDSARIVKKFRESLDELDVKMGEGLNPELSFKGSIISKDKGSRKLIKDAIDLLAEDVDIDALRAHKLKRQLDSLINYKKTKSFSGLPASGKRVLVGLRKEINEALRETNPDYARVNDTIHSGLNAMEGMEKAVGPSINIWETGGVSALGRDSRSLLSNNKSRQRLSSAISRVEETAIAMGGQYDDKITTMVRAANALEDVHGAMARSSIKGEIASANKFSTMGKRELVEHGVKWATGKGRGINEHNAFNAIEKVLSEGK